MAPDALNTSLRWRLRRRPVCASTELELDRWLRSLGSNPGLENRALAVVARRQRHGRGQRGRTWISPAGGLWLSAALAWPIPAATGGAPLTLAAAVGLALQLETLGLTPQIKWPNDLLIGGRKLAGLLPRLRLAGGRVRWAQVGLGLNGINRTPAQAIGVGEALQAHPLGHPRPGGGRFHPMAKPEALLPLALGALAWAQHHANRPELVQQLVNERLYRPSGGWSHLGSLWQVDGIGVDGSLALSRPGQRTVLRGLDLSPADPA